MKKPAIITVLVAALLGLLVITYSLATSGNNSNSNATPIAQGAPTSTTGAAATATTPDVAQIAAVSPTGNTTPSLPQLAPGWTKIEPGGATTCARGTPYAFWVRPGTVNKLLLFFEGGGGCWNAETCKEGSTYFDDTVDEGDAPTMSGGVFVLDNPDNPFKDYYMVYVPVCTGDVHMGNKVMTYKDTDGTEIIIHHTGFVNASAAVDWAYEHFGGPQSIFITGCSAGSVGSITFAPYVIRHYPDAQVTQLGDSLAFVLDHALDLQSEWQAHDNFPPWIPAMQDLGPGKFTTAGFYSAIARFYPDYVFAQYNSAHDSVQQRYYFAAARTPTPAPFEDALQTSLAQIHERAPNFRSYTAAGFAHCIMPTPRFYTNETSGVRFRDWVADLEDGKAVGDVKCGEC
jgi:hypothetical protein